MNLFDFFTAIKELYSQAVTPVCKKHALTLMEFNVLLFLANNPAYTTAGQIVEQRRLTKSHVSLAVRSLTERGLLRGEYRGNNRRTVHLLVCEGASSIIADGRAAQKQFIEMLYTGFSDCERAEIQTYLDRFGRNVLALSGKRES